MKVWSVQTRLVSKGTSSFAAISSRTIHSGEPYKMHSKGRQKLTASHSRLVQLYVRKLVFPSATSCCQNGLFWHSQSAGPELNQAQQVADDHSRTKLADLPKSQLRDLAQAVCCATWPTSDDPLRDTLQTLDSLINDFQSPNDTREPTALTCT